LQKLASFVAESRNAQDSVDAFDRIATRELSRGATVQATPEGVLPGTSRRLFFDFRSLKLEASWLAASQDS
jgi:hypothetical protein